VLSYVVNEVLFAQPQLRCGCLCTAYTTPDGGYTFKLAAYSRRDGANRTVWLPQLVDPRPNSRGGGETYPWDTRVLTCSGGYDASRCGAAYSEARNRPFCAVTAPVRWAPALQVPNPPWRPAPAAHGTLPDEPGWNESWAWQLSGSATRDTSVRRRVNASRAAPFLFTGDAAAAALHDSLARRLTFAPAAAAALAAVVDAQLASLAASAARNASASDALLATPLAAFAADVLGPIGDVARVPEVVPMRPLAPLLLGTAALQPRGGLQREDCFAGRPLKILMADCGVSVAPRTRGNLSAALGRLLGNVDVACVSLPGARVADAEALHSALFAGYGRGGGAVGAAAGATAGAAPIAAYPFAVDFRDTRLAQASAAPRLALTLLYNGTLAFNDAPVAAASGVAAEQPPPFFRVHAPLNRLANAYLDALLRRDGGAAGSAAAADAAGPRASLRYIRDMPTRGASLRLDVGALLGPLFYTWLSQMLLPVMVGTLVYEKERQLRTMMRLHGLGDGPYLAVNYLYYFALHLVFLLLMYAFGAALGAAAGALPMWTRSAPGVVVAFFALFAHAQLAAAFLLQAVFASAKTATVGCVVYLLVTGLLAKFLFEPFLESPSFNLDRPGGILAMQLLLPFALYRGFYELAAFGAAAAANPRGSGAASVGISWAKVAGGGSIGGGMAGVMVIFVVEGIILGLLGCYLDQVYATGSGVKRHPLFLLQRWMGARERERDVANEDAEAHDAAAVADGSSAFTALDTDAPDVAACRDAALGVHAPGDVAVLAQRLRKTYPGVHGAPPTVACRELSVAIPAGECFGLLGPNGAGKSTAINLLIGFLTPTSGAAYINGFNLQAAGARAVHCSLGVCPQHDLLWEALSAREHLRFYGRLKRLAGAALEAACDDALRGVNLHTGGVGDRPCSTYSGGMKRRLSVAIALIGDPAVVFLDEVRRAASAVASCHMPVATFANVTTPPSPDTCAVRVACSPARAWTPPPAPRCGPSSSAPSAAPRLC
jgi:ABC-type Na+ transport system ATPase subunit NatA